MMMKIVDSMHDKFDQVYKSPKLFISHATSDKTIIEKFVTMLEQIGVNHHQLFCSSINAYGIPQGAGNIYDYIQNEMSNDNLFVIMMLSQNYYDSYMCLNEMGAAWIKKSKYQSILLPGFNFPDIQGAIDPRDICFKLDDPENRNYALNDLKDRITEHLELLTNRMVVNLGFVSLIQIKCIYNCFQYFARINIHWQEIIFVQNPCISNEVR